MGEVGEAGGVGEAEGLGWVSLDMHLPADVESDAVGEWQENADRIRGWQYRIADYKANLLTRQWEDILTPEEGADE